MASMSPARSRAMQADAMAAMPVLKQAVATPSSILVTLDSSAAVVGLP